MATLRCKTFTAVHKDEIDTFHKRLHRQNPHIQFTREIEENGKIKFFRVLKISGKMCFRRYELSRDLHKCI